MSAAHTQGPYTVEKCIHVGRRGGKRHDGWHIKLNGTLVGWSRQKAHAQEIADRLNAAAAERVAISKATGQQGGTA